MTRALQGVSETSTALATATKQLAVYSAVTYAGIGAVAACGLLLLRDVIKKR